MHFEHNFTNSVLLSASHKTAAGIIWASSFLSTACPCLYSNASLFNHTGGIIQCVSFLLRERKHGSVKTWTWNFEEYKD